MTEFEKKELAKWRSLVDVIQLIQAVALIAIEITLFIHILK